MRQHRSRLLLAWCSHRRSYRRWTSGVISTFHGRKGSCHPVSHGNGLPRGLFLSRSVDGNDRLPLRWLLPHQMRGCCWKFLGVTAWPWEECYNLNTVLVMHVRRSWLYDRYGMGWVIIWCASCLLFLPSTIIHHRLMTCPIRRILHQNLIPCPNKTLPLLIRRRPHRPLHRLNLPPLPPSHLHSYGRRWLLFPLCPYCQDTWV